MQGSKFTQSFHIPGTLAANIVIAYTVPFDCQLEHISMVGSNANDATLKVGTSADDDGFLTATGIGDSGTPVEIALANFNGVLVSEPGKSYPRLPDGTIFLATLDYDGSSGTAAQNVTLIFTFSEG